ncbi:MAG: hypothetical protein KDC83_04230 [Flavobacteriales bacterium]|nr:hypothetical protein [Flavobacteriales bacterium]
MFYWAILFGIVSQNFANKYGIPHLLLFPEYLGQVNFLSHVFLGAAFGGFVMAFQISSYIMNGFRFPFIATLANPFMKYQINNFIIPAVFTGYYTYKLIHFQLHSELLEPEQVGLNLLGFFAGSVFFISISTAYFLSTNNSIMKYLPFKEIESKGHKIRPIKNLFNPSLKWYQFYKRTSDWKIETYLTGMFKIALARSSMHYPKEVLQKVFKQNHLNASMFEVGALLSVLSLGYFMENPVFAIPAGASIFLLFTLILLFSGALHHWFRSWSFTGFIVIFISFSLLLESNLLKRNNQAYGLDYGQPLTEYNHHNLKKILADSIAIEKSFQDEIKSLNHWKSHVKDRTMVLINTSGGGLRSATWSFHCLQQIDSVTSNRLMASTRLICGASGGMIGSSYYRELYLHHLLENRQTGINGKNIDNMAKDILNPLSFAWVVNDLMIQYKYFEYNGLIYAKDRAYFFEKQLIQNTQGMLDKELGFYTSFVDQGMIPEMILTPTVANDGRRLLIGSRSTLYLNVAKKESEIMKSGNLDFFALFDGHGAPKMKFSSALRMNATFPYVLPNVTLPTDPRIEVMDAGIRDNYGYSTTMDYLKCIEHWADTALDNIVIVRIFDRPEIIRLKEKPKLSFIQSLFVPVGSVYTNMFNVQHMNGAQLYEFIPSSLQKKVRMVDFILDEKTGADIPLSWHITKRAEKDIEKGLKTPENQRSLNKLKSLLKVE